MSELFVDGWKTQFEIASMQTTPPGVGENGSTGTKKVLLGQ